MVKHPPPWGYCAWLGQKQTSHRYNSVLSVGQFQGTVSYGKNSRESYELYEALLAQLLCQSTKCGTESISQEYHHHQFTPANT